MKIRAVIFAAFSLQACNQTEPNAPYDSYSENLAEALREKPQPFSRAYAIVKIGSHGRDWLGTIHGLNDNRSACEEIITPYNEDPELSIWPGSYTCEEVNDSFRAPEPLSSF